MSTALADLHLLRPWWLLALPVLWALVFWLARRRSRQGNWSSVVDADLLAALRLDAGSVTSRRSPWPWLAGAWTIAVLALAGPSWEHDASNAFRAPAAWVVVLDLSPSMSAADQSPDRATRARYALDDLLSSARDTRVGLVVFSDEPYTVAPLTDDVATIRALLEPLAPAIMPSPGDRLAPALDRAGQLLASSATKDRRVILLSDGFADPASAFASASKLRTAGVRVDVVAVGTAAGAPIRNAAGGFERDEQGATRLARPDLDSLRNLAAAGGGREVDLNAVTSLVAGGAGPQGFAQGEASATASKVTLEHWRDGGAWLLPAVLLLAATLARRGWL